MVTKCSKSMKNFSKAIKKAESLLKQNAAEIQEMEFEEFFTQLLRDLCMENKFTDAKKLSDLYMESLKIPSDSLMEFFKRSGLIGSMSRLLHLNRFSDCLKMVEVFGLKTNAAFVNKLSSLLMVNSKYEEFLKLKRTRNGDLSEPDTKLFIEEIANSGNFKAALRYCDQLKVNAQEYQVPLLLKLMLENGQVEEAGRYYKVFGYTSSPEAEIIYQNIANAYLANGDWKKGKECITNLENHGHLIELFSDSRVCKSLIESRNWPKLFKFLTSTDNFKNENLIQGVIRALIDKKAYAQAFSCVLKSKLTESFPVEFFAVRLMESGNFGQLDNLLHDFKIDPSLNEKLVRVLNSAQAYKLRALHQFRSVVQRLKPQSSNFTPKPAQAPVVNELCFEECQIAVPSVPVFDDIHLLQTKDRFMYFSRLSKKSIEFDKLYLLRKELPTELSALVCNIGLPSTAGIAQIPGMGVMNHGAIDHTSDGSQQRTGFYERMQQVVTDPMNISRDARFNKVRHSPIPPPDRYNEVQRFSNGLANNMYNMHAPGAKDPMNGSPGQDSRNFYGSPRPVMPPSMQPPPSVGQYEQEYRVNKLVDSLIKLYREAAEVKKNIVFLGNRYEEAVQRSDTKRQILIREDLSKLHKIQQQHRMKESKILELRRSDVDIAKALSIFTQLKANGELSHNSPTPGDRFRRENSRSMYPPEPIQPRPSFDTFKFDFGNQMSTARPPAHIQPAESVGYVGSRVQNQTPQDGFKGDFLKNVGDSVNMIYSDSFPGFPKPSETENDEIYLKPHP